LKKVGFAVTSQSLLKNVNSKKILFDHPLSVKK